jgi:hypothetical protein
MMSSNMEHRNSLNLSAKLTATFRVESSEAWNDWQGDVLLQHKRSCEVS